MQKIKDYLRKQKAKNELIKAFNNAGLFKSYKNSGGKTVYNYPTIHDVHFNDEEKSTRYVFTLLNGIDPKEIKKKEYVWKQHFGDNLEIEGDLKKFIFTVHSKKLPKKVNYNYKEILKIIEENEILVPIVSGKDRHSKLHVYDATNAPNLLIFGEPGSGKSSILHVILSTLIQRFSPEELNLYLGDFKMSEMPVYENVKHVKSISYQTKDIKPALKHLNNELAKRGELLKKYRVRHVNKIPKGERPPTIILCIDEFVMIKNEDVVDDLLQIVSLGRAYSILCILSMQRPSHTILSTDIRGMLSVRMGFKTVDLKNAMMGETPGSEKISKETPGRFLLNKEDLSELQAPYLDEDGVEKIIKKYKSDDWVNHSFKQQIHEEQKQPEEEQPKLTKNDIFGRLE